MLRANEHEVNTECLDVSGYERMVTVVKQHEQEHLDDFADVVREHDIYGKWDALVGRSRREVVEDAKEFAKAAHDDMLARANEIDPPSYAGWEWWLYKYGSWELAVHK